MSAEPDAAIVRLMRADWDQRADENAFHFVSWAGCNQSEVDFARSGKGMAKFVLRWARTLLPPERFGAVLEIGCGPGRLLGPLSRHFARAAGADIAPRMIALARERLRGLRNVRLETVDGDLRPFADASFDLVFSYAVFQHIPERELVLRYVDEARRVLRPGGALVAQFSGAPPAYAQPRDSWNGDWIAAADLSAVLAARGFTIHAMSGHDTQHLWAMCRKAPAPAHAPADSVAARCLGMGGSARVPHRGPRAQIVVKSGEIDPGWLDIAHLEAVVGGRPARVIEALPGRVVVLLPAGAGLGAQTVEVRFRGALLCSGSVHVAVAPPWVPRLELVCDGVDLGLRNRSDSGWLKVFLGFCDTPESLTVHLDGHRLLPDRTVCLDVPSGKYELNLRLPDSLPRGAHRLRIRDNSHCLERRLWTDGGAPA